MQISFHNRCARYIAGQYTRQNEDETWTCPAKNEVLEKAGIFSSCLYISKRRGSIEDYTKNLTVYKKFVALHPLSTNPKQQVECNKKLSVHILYFVVKLYFIVICLQKLYIQEY